eukprot:symbB.v1.2.001544.t1/scaffold85.1/size341090/4
MELVTIGVGQRMQFFDLQVAGKPSRCTVAPLHARDAVATYVAILGQKDSAAFWPDTFSAKSPPLECCENCSLDPEDLTLDFDLGKKKNGKREAAAQRDARAHSLQKAAVASAEDWAEKKNQQASEKSQAEERAQREEDERRRQKEALYRKKQRERLVEWHQQKAEELAAKQAAEERRQEEEEVVKKEKKQSSSHRLP